MVAFQIRFYGRLYLLPDRKIIFSENIYFLQLIRIELIEEYFAKVLLLLYSLFFRLFLIRGWSLSKFVFMIAFICCLIEKLFFQRIFISYDLFESN